MLGKTKTDEMEAFSNTNCHLLFVTDLFVASTKVRDLSNLVLYNKLTVYSCILMLFCVNSF